MLEHWSGVFALISSKRATAANRLAAVSVGARTYTEIDGQPVISILKEIKTIGTRHRGAYSYRHNHRTLRSRTSFGGAVVRAVPAFDN